MDIFEFAMDKEKYSELYYRDLAQRSTHEGLRNILTMLADEEAKHYHTVEQMKAGTPPEVAESPVLANAKKVFEKIRKAGEKFDFHMSEADLYRKAAKIEEESKRFYEQKAAGGDGPRPEEDLRETRPRGGQAPVPRGPAPQLRLPSGDLPGKRRDVPLQRLRRRRVLR